MLFHVRMDVHLPDSMSNQEKEHLKTIEKEYSLTLQETGKWKYIWRIVGQYANISIFDVSDNEELHQILSHLPLFPYMDIKVIPLCTHPSDLQKQENSSCMQ